ncbi:MAG TPA: glycerol-3-phosphate acyltransferase, partial [Usitatibacter sp.]
MTQLLYALGGYLAGSIPFAVIVSRAMALPDPRTYGSGNVGATNVLRSGHRIAALLTLAGDAGKGWAAVIAARFAGASDELLAIVAIAAFLGHVFPVWLRFRGGKGVATAA